jgi:hypothetical protein
MRLKEPLALLGILLVSVAAWQLVCGRQNLDDAYQLVFAAITEYEIVFPVLLGHYREIDIRFHFSDCA